MAPPDWFPDEAAHAGEEHFDARYVACYERKTGTDPVFDDDLAVLREHASGGTLVDLGAGAGALALVAARFCRRVVAVDVSPTMLAAVSARIRRLGLDNVECVQRGFLTYEHEGAPADAAYSRNALHHLPDFWKALALRRVAAVLRPGGVLRLRDIVFSCGAGEAELVAEAWLDGAAERPEDGWTRAELELHLREEHSTFTWLLEQMLERAGFEILEASSTPSRAYAAYTCVKA